MQEKVRFSTTVRVIESVYVRARERESEVARVRESEGVGKPVRERGNVCVYVTFAVAESQESSTEWYSVLLRALSQKYEDPYTKEPSTH